MLLISQKTYKNVVNLLVSPKFEQGGIIGTKNGVISFFELDITPSVCSPRSYSPNCKMLEKTIEIWREYNIIFAGIVHSHHQNIEPSSEDIYYMRQIISTNNLSQILLGIVLTPKKTLTLYSVTKNNVIKQDTRITNREVF
ncbi:MAG: hypothetical protein IJ391_01165 [Clostridia bacterium]|nr:hypothetical protein [Clostridia bacterium]